MSWTRSTARSFAARSVSGDPARDFCSNDYLGLARDPEVVAQVRARHDRDAVGAGASRLVSGTLPGHHALERTLAELAARACRAALYLGLSGEHGDPGRPPAAGDTVVSMPEITRA